MGSIHTTGQGRRVNRRDFLKASGFAVAGLWGASAATGWAEAPQGRPNILWITCEDISPYLGCYGCAEAHTPNLDKLASEGIRFSQAYANGPVCSVARSALLTGMHSPTLGTHNMRALTQLPDSIPAYPKIFRQAGYYCTNNSKTDYNSSFMNKINMLWHKSSEQAHWKNRHDGQPFFAVFNILETHESQLNRDRINHYVNTGQIPKTPRINPADIELPPYHPDLPEIRQDWARLHDLITLMDKRVGQRLDELEQAGLAEDTIVFFYSDHGGMLSRSKRYIYDGGHHVPLIVRFPKKWQHAAPSTPGSVSDRLVEFVDLPKTVLSLAGLPIPETMQGHIFLGPNTEPEPKNVCLYRDRMPERPDFCRAMTDGRWYYIRNFMPHRPNGRDSRYGYEVQANWGAWQEHYDAGKCDPVQSMFFLPKPVMQLFDTQNDPWQVNNLAEKPEHRQRIDRMQAEMDRWMIENRDIGLIPESLFYDLVGPDKEFKTLYEYAQSKHFAVEDVLGVVKETSLGDPSRLGRYLRWIKDDNPMIRHWAAYGLFLVRSRTPHVQTALRNMIAQDSMGGNRVMAAMALGLCGDPETAFKAIYQEARQTDHGYVFMLAINAFQYSHTDERLTRDDWNLLKKRTENNGDTEDRFGFEYANRTISDALEIWPQRRIVD